MKKLNLSVVLFATSAVVVSCGGRTWDLSPDTEFPFPDAGHGGASGFGEGGAVSSGGAVAIGGRAGGGGAFVSGGRVGAGGFVSSGGYGTGGRVPYTGGYAGYGAYPVGGYGGYGYGGYGYAGYAGYGYGGYGYGGYGYAGYAGYGYGGYGYAGYAGYGGAPVCAQPFCNCAYSCTECYCLGYGPMYCSAACGGGGYGGTAGAAGATSTGGTTSSIVCPAEVCPGDLAAPCCTGAGFCGVSLPVSTDQFGIQGGCQPLDQPGSVDSSCPSFAALNGPVVPDFNGCCRSDGTCGVYVNASSYPLGCVQIVTPGGMELGCKPLGQGGSAGAIGAGGAPAVGGGGFGAVSSGGVGGAAAQQCVSQARSDCERCACGSCYDSLIPCFKDAGCPQILACANRTGCNGLNCYDATTCRDVIDKAGGLSSPSISLALPLFTCVTSLNCPCGFK